MEWSTTMEKCALDPVLLFAIPAGDDFFGDGVSSAKGDKDDGPGLRPMRPQSIVYEELGPRIEKLANHIRLPKSWTTPWSNEFLFFWVFGFRTWRVYGWLRDSLDHGVVHDKGVVHDYGGVRVGPSFVFRDSSGR